MTEEPRLRKAPAQSTGVEREVAAMGNVELALRLRNIATTPHKLDRSQRDAALMEAAKRLQWPDNYEKHKRP